MDRPQHERPAQEAPGEETNLQFTSSTAGWAAKEVSCAGVKLAGRRAVMFSCTEKPVLAGRGWARCSTITEEGWVTSTLVVAGALELSTDTRSLKDLLD